MITILIDEERKMRTTKKYIQKIIREELDKVLNETAYSEVHGKLVDLIVTGQEGLNQALELFNQVKGMGMLQPSEEDHIQRLSDYASAVYKHISLSTEISSIRKEIGRVPAPKDKRYWELKKERSANLRAMRELEHNINPRDKRMLAQATGFA